MKTSYFLSPKHPSKICDIAVEVLLDYYRKQDIDFYSDIFSFIKNDQIIIEGRMDTSSPIADVELVEEIQKEIGTEYTIINNVVTEQYEGDFVEKTFSGIYLGYSCVEVDEFIPFEHQEAKSLTKLIYDRLDIAIKVQVHINGNRLAISLEHNHDNLEEIDEIIREFAERPDDGTANVYNEPEIYHSEIRNDVVYKSTDSITSTFYGPRAWYGEVDFIGSDFLSNKRISHLIVREIANDYAKLRNLSYCAVELDFTDGDPRPIHFGIKGNTNGIHLENGTFFEFGDIENEYPQYKQKVIDKIKSGEINIVEIAKWGFEDMSI